MTLPFLKLYCKDFKTFLTNEEEKEKKAFEVFFRSLLVVIQYFVLHGALLAQKDFNTAVYLRKLLIECFELA